MKVTFTIDIPQADFKKLCKKMEMKKLHKIPNVLEGKKGAITSLSYYPPKFPGDLPEGEMTIVIPKPYKLKQI